MMNFFLRVAQHDLQRCVYRVVLVLRAVYSIMLGFCMIQPQYYFKIMLFPCWTAQYHSDFLRLKAGGCEVLLDGNALGYMYSILQ